MTECAICLGDIDVARTAQVVQLSCKHVYHRPCLRAWFRRSPLCPLCKAAPKVWPFPDLFIPASPDDVDFLESDSESSSDDDSSESADMDGEEEDEDDHEMELDESEGLEDDVVVENARTRVDLLVRALESNDVTLTSLDSERLDFPLGEEHGVRLCRALSTNMHVNRLVLTDRGVGNLTASMLGTIIARNRCMRVLDLSENESVNDHGIASIAKGLVRNTRITHLYLNSLNIGDDGMSALCKALTRNKTLQVLGMRATRLTDAGVRMIASIICNSSLVCLDIQNNARVTSRAIRALTLANGARSTPCILVL